MAVQFNQIPGSGLRTPGYYGEINGAQTPYTSSSRHLLLGQKLSTGAAASGVPVQIIGDPRDLFGAKSMLVRACEAERLNAPFQELWVLPMDDAAAGVAATGACKVTMGTYLTQSMTLGLWLGDVPVYVVAYVGDTDTAIAARLAAAINAEERTPVTAAINGGDATQIDFTATHKGEAGNSIVLDTNYYGTESPVSAAVFAITAMSGGAGNPDFTAALADLADEPFDWITGPYTDAVNLPAIQLFLNKVSGRWSPLKQLFGHYVGVDHNTIAAQQTTAALYSEETTSSFGTYKCASPSWVIAGALGGRIAAHLSDAPELSRPLQTLQLIGCLPPKLPSNRPDITTRNVLYHAGVGSYTVEGKTRTMEIDRVVTHYRVNAWGSTDAVWLDIETRGQAMYVSRALKAAVTGQYPRAGLMNENPDGLQGFATPRDIRNVLIHEYKRLNRLGVVENPELFAEALVVERDATDATRLNCYVPIDVANQLRITAVNITLFLQRAA